MKAKVKATGEIIELKENRSLIERARGIYKDKISGRKLMKHELDFLFDNNTDWEHVRITASIHAMKEILSKDKNIDVRKMKYSLYKEDMIDSIKDVSELSVLIADCLVEELKK